MPRKSTTILSKDPDYDPLLKTFNHEFPSKGIILNRREHRALKTERYGRIRLGLFIIILFLAVYFAFSLTSSNWQDFVVTMPMDDDSLPGPKGYSVFPGKTISNRKLATTNVYYVYSNQTVPHGFLVYGDGCRIPDLNPLASDVMKLFHKEGYKECSKKKPLTKIIHNFTTNSVYLIRDEAGKQDYDSDLYCCYQEITRHGEGKTADNEFKLSQCTVFQDFVELPSTIEFILVKCRAQQGDSKDKSLYKNVHAVVRDRPDIRSRLDETKTQFNTRPLSVLMIGIDSISRLNLIRAMPKTAQHLYDTGWFELRGYNKIDDNTFPNLMALLTGYNGSLAYSICNPETVGKLDKCLFMWNYYKDSGYVTAYAEDEAELNTFNYEKYGFINIPTDFYLRPLMLAAEKNLPIDYKSRLTFCLGYTHSADYIYNYALDFVSVYKEDPYFGFFWTNTFSHNDISDPSSMDQKIKNYLLEFEERGVLNNSMVVFFSDHGIRYGPVRTLVTGWLEERLPFMFIWLPPWFKEEHPEIVQILKINRNRLTNPYDMHMTLKHILELSNRSGGLPPATSCPQCQSVFEEIPVNRSCVESEIAPHWCTCTPYVTIKDRPPIIKNAVKFAINYMNNELTRYSNGKKKICADLKLKKIIFARQADYLNVTKLHDDNLLVFETVPGNGIFESTVRYHIEEKRYEITGSISRLNRYKTQSICMHVDYLKKYCFCLK